VSSRPLRIVHCFRSPVGGIFRHVRDLSLAQERQGHQVAIVCDASTGGEYEAQLIADLSPHLSLGAHRTPMQRHIGPGYLGSAWRSWTLIKGLRPDVLHGHGAKGGFYARAFGSMLRVGRSRVARLYSPHGGSLHYDASTTTGKAFFLIERLLETMTDHLVFVADYERRTFAEKVGGPHTAWSVVYNGLAPAEFEPVAPASSAADFLYIGMMRALKGPDLFIEALADVERRTGRKPTAAMVGAGDDLPAAKAQVERLGLGGSVSFHDPMPARAAFAMARTVVVPSRAEAMPYIVLEALGAAKPLIATRVGGIPEIFANAPAALCDVSASSLGERMATALTDPAGFAASMPTREDLESRFSVEAMAGAIARIYDGILSGR